MVKTGEQKQDLVPYLERKFTHISFQKGDVNAFGLDLFLNADSSNATCVSFAPLPITNMLMPET
jgi:hypothetical protein